MTREFTIRAIDTHERPVGARILVGPDDPQRIPAYTEATVAITFTGGAAVPVTVKGPGTLRAVSRLLRPDDPQVQTFVLTPSTDG